MFHSRGRPTESGGERTTIPDLDDRAQRIVDAALELAEEGGFEAVRMRDIASHADVALGTLYKRFRSKEDILVAALEQELSTAESRLANIAIPGDAPLDRLGLFFGTVTRYLVSKPRLARAVLRAAASGEPELAQKVTRFHDRMAGLIATAYRGGAEESELPATLERRLTDILQRIWFASLVGWMGGLHDEAACVEQVMTGARWLVAGLHAEVADSLN